MTRGLLGAILTLFLLAGMTTQAFARAQRVVADIRWNGQSEGRTLIVLQGNDILIPRHYLEKNGVAAGDRGSVRINGEPFVALSTFAPNLTFAFNPQTFILSVRTQPSMLPHRSISVSQAPQAYENHFVKALVTNYDLRMNSGSLISGGVIQRLDFAPHSVFENSFGRTTSGNIARGNSSLTIDSRKHLRRTIVGDSVMTGGLLGSSVAIGGVSVSRTFSLDPYDPTFTMPSMHVTVTRPSEADLYVNGMLVKTLDLLPGNYELNDIPLQAGYSDARLIIRNEFGEQSKDVLGYGAPLLLRKGLTDYQYGMGFERLDAFRNEAAYGPLVGSIRYRIGTSAYSTAGAILQATPGGLDADLDYAGIWRFAYVEFGAAASRFDGQDGTAAAFAYSVSGIRTSASFQATVQSGSFETVGIAAAPDALTSEVSLTGAARLDAATTVAFTARSDMYRRSGELRDAELLLTHRFGDWNLAAGYTMASNGSFTRGQKRTFTATLTRAVCCSTTESLTERSSGGRASLSTVVAHAGDSLFASSYSAAFDSRGDRPMSANAHIGTPFAFANVYAIGSERSNSVAAEIAGSIVYADRQTFFAQPIDDAFGIVDADGVKHLPVFLGGQYARRTDGRGYMVLPFLNSNQVNDVGISNAGLPLQDSFETNELRIGPGYHAGSKIHFKMHKTHAVYGDLRVRYGGGYRVPFYGEIDVTSTSESTISSPIDGSGRFYLDGVREGRYVAKISYRGGECTMRFDVPSFAGGAYDLGTLVCGN